MQQIRHAAIKIDTDVNWAKATNYIPPQGMFLVYEFVDRAPMIKIGDGKTSVVDLDFINQSKSKVVDEGTLEL